VHLGDRTRRGNLFQRLANRIIYSDHRCAPRRPRWPATIGERPVCGPTAYRATCPSHGGGSTEAEDLNIVRQLLPRPRVLAAEAPGRRPGILSEQGATYAQDLHDSLETLVRTSQSTLFPEGHRGRAASTFCVATSSRPRTARSSRQQPGRASERRGSLADQVIRLERPAEGSASPAPRPGSSRP